MRDRRFVTLVLAGSVLLPALSPTQAAPASVTAPGDPVLAQPVEQQIQGLNHFFCYKYKPRFKKGFKGPRIRLEDQFLNRTTKAKKPQLHCNPVEKRHAGETTKIARNLDHLTIYPTKDAPAQPERVVAILNQFGMQQFLHLGQPTSVGVPSLKASGKARAPRKPQLKKLGTDHFQCWDVTQFNQEGNPTGVKVRLTDQTGVATTTIKRPTTLCNPAHKQHGKKVTEAVNLQAHLVCYATGKVSFKQVFERQFDWKVRNQFGTHELIWPRDRVPRPAFRLCVPSVKVFQGTQ